MNKYSFLFKPVFFVFNLIFATWLVLAIEKIQPSDFGKYKSIFDKAPKPKTVTTNDKDYLKALFIKYKTGQLDSLNLEKELDKFVAPVVED
ncbi:MAG: hypothetical protein K0S32_452 [Bacteroidetes bacterium]|jgi:hypothetical protein|nr:hypothetical protein [Bacteroidota bacterium]